MKMLHAFLTVSGTVFVLLTAAYLYQVFYMIVGLAYRRGKKKHGLEPVKLLNYGVFISARNEQSVIGELIESIKSQTYPQDKIKIFVMADNCTDGTARAARDAGVVVYERHSETKKGKGYALDELYRRVVHDYGHNAFDGFFVFDADNILDKNFITEMNRTFASGNYDCVTSYRNSKNFGTNWITASYSIWFLREARYMNLPRYLLGTSCMISGTGFLVSSQLLEENGGWPYHLLTEDIEFSVNCAFKGKRIGYCDGAILYDEQPVTFSQSWEQRLRWSKGFFQIDFRYIPDLVKGCFTAKKNRHSCYDVLMTVAPASLVTIGMIIYHIIFFIFASGLGTYYRAILWGIAAQSLVFGAISFYAGLLLIGIITVATEWKRIRATTLQKIIYLPLFPIFQATYLPLTIEALFKKVEWKHIEHHSVEQLAEVGK
ncbi:MAG: glycosyltransferase family 2 protein [Oscillospiraceae bacterium]|jgi:cellulose synthase/poly-beta-1,6-N-acetylglucosamine synthase-like glycosyltransferase